MVLQLSKGAYCRAGITRATVKENPETAARSHARLNPGGMFK
jgi:hypothetical protein